MSILTGPEIARQVGAGRILIEPFDPRQVNPASYDVRLGETILEVLPNYSLSCNCCEPSHHYEPTVIDPKKPTDAKFFASNQPTLLQPGRLYLGHTRERIRTDHYEPTIDGKSSIGRLGVFIHVTAGYGEPGFDGQYTLEIVVTLPTILYPGMRIGQARFTTLEGEVELYRGNYSGEYSKGPVPSRAWRQFEQDREELGVLATGGVNATDVTPWVPSDGRLSPLIIKRDGESWTQWLERGVAEKRLPPGIVKAFRDHPVMNQPFDPPAEGELYDAVKELVENYGRLP